MRILGLDFGSKTVGVAMSDPLGITAQGIEIIAREKENHMRKTMRRLDDLIAENDVKAIVLGYPKNMNNTLGDRAAKTIEFKTTLEERTSLPVFLWDERLTTVEAERTMIAAEIRREDRKKYVDKIAAVLILQGWLDANAEKIDELLND